MTGRYRPLIVCALLVSAFATASAQPAFNALQPGQFREIEQNLQINIVFVGYRTFANVNTAFLLANLPKTYRAVNRLPSLKAGQLEFSGNKFDFGYNIVNSTQAFDNAYFAYLNSIAVAKPRTTYQDLYNQQPARRLNIGQNYQIDAVDAERWLAENAGPMLGVDTRQYTIFFVNWFGRSDFKFHVYARVGQRDPDTGASVGLDDFVQKISGGGTPADDPHTPLGSLRRVWFYDMSAGPDYNSRSWDLSVKDVDGDGFNDWRIPPIWEYGNLKAYRPFNTFSTDHYLLIRYIAIDLLFTASPLYRVALSPPKLPSNLAVDVTFFEGNPARNAAANFSPTAAGSILSALQPFNHFTVRTRDLPFDGGAKRVYDCNYLDANCYGNRFPGNKSFGDMYLYFSDRLLQFLSGDADYEIPVFAYSTTDDYANGFLGGAAIDNFRDGTQSMIFETLPEVYFSTNNNYGWTGNVLHEVGHHLGLSHPHDGFDYESGFHYGARGSTFFVWDGDSSSTLMGYLGDSTGFSQFDRDNMARWCTAAYINEANAILPKVLASARATEVSELLHDADVMAGNALAAYQTMDYVEAVTWAKSAYDRVLAAAASIHVPVENEAWQADVRAKSSNDMFDGAVDDFRQLPPRR
jgi:hypothetical protein